MLAKYKILPIDAGSLPTRVKQVWRRVTFEPDDVKELRDRITSSVSLLNTRVINIYGYLFINYFLSGGGFKTDLAQASNTRNEEGGGSYQ